MNCFIIRGKNSSSKKNTYFFERTFFSDKVIKTGKIERLWKDQKMYIIFVILYLLSYFLLIYSLSNYKTSNIFFLLEIYFLISLVIFIDMKMKAFILVSSIFLFFILRELFSIYDNIKKFSQITDETKKCIELYAKFFDNNSFFVYLNYSDIEKLYFQEFFYKIKIRNLLFLLIPSFIFKFCLFLHSLFSRSFHFRLKLILFNLCLLIFFLVFLVFFMRSKKVSL